MSEITTEIVSFSNYNDFKQIMDAEISEAAAGFVRIGYLLKLAKETDILKESEYSDVNEFAKKEYGLTRDMVSRYIDINTKYSEGGCSDRLQEKYRAFGYSKLAEMLTLPEHIAEEITPDYTRAEIREIKAELKAEEETTDLELLMERQQEENASEKMQEETLLYKLMCEYFRDNPKEYVEIHGIMWQTIREGKDKVPKKIVEVIAPSGTATLIIRIPGVGRFLVSIRSDSKNIIIKNMRDESFREIYSWDQLDDCMDMICDGDADDSAEIKWEKKYSTPFPKESVKEESAQKEKTAKKESKVKKSVPKKEKSVSKTVKNAIKTGENIQSILENESIVPESEPPVAVGTENEEIAPAQQSENVINTEAEPVKIEKVEGEVIEAQLDSRKAMLIQKIHEDKKRLNQLLEEKAWTGAKLAAVDLQMTLEQLIACITREQEE